MKKSLLLIMVMSLLSACGQYGKLYLPTPAETEKADAVPIEQPAIE